MVLTVRTIFMGVALVALVVLGLNGCGLFGGPTRDDSGQIVESGTIDVLDLRVGDCFNHVEDGDNSNQRIGVPCSEPHRFEVYHLFDLQDGQYPGSQIEELWLQGCLEEFEAFVGLPFDQSSLDISAIFPTESTWAEGDREVLCAVTPVATVEGEVPPRTLSARNSRI